MFRLNLPWAKRWWVEGIDRSASVLDWCFPPLCAYCRDNLRSDNCLCPSCLADLHLWGTQAAPPAISTPQTPIINPLFVYEKAGVGARLIHQFKYNKRLLIGRYLAARYADQLQTMDLRYDILIPVPMHWRRRWVRGFNQSAIIAQVLSKALNIPTLEGCLVRSRYTKRQVGQEAQDRWHNVAHCFALRHPERLRNKRILILDDVITTGATTRYCAELIHQAGALVVHTGALAAQGNGSD